MVDALHRAHRLTRTGGLLLDLHPLARNDLLEVWRDGVIESIGEVDQQEDIADIEYAEGALDKVVEEGLFQRVDQREFDLLEHHPTVESWLDRWNEEGWAFEVAEDVMRSAREALGTPGSEFVVREPIRITRLNRL